MSLRFKGPISPNPLRPNALASTSRASRGQPRSSSGLRSPGNPFYWPGDPPSRSRVGASPNPNRRYESFDTDAGELKDFTDLQKEHEAQVNEIASLQNGLRLPEGNHSFAELQAFHNKVKAAQEALHQDKAHLDSLDMFERRHPKSEDQNAIRGAVYHQGSPISNSVSVNRNNQPRPKPTPNREGDPRKDAAVATARRAELKPRKNSERTGSNDPSEITRNA